MVHSTLPPSLSLARTHTHAHTHTHTHTSPSLSLANLCLPSFSLSRHGVECPRPQDLHQAYAEGIMGVLGEGEGSNEQEGLSAIMFITLHHPTLLKRHFLRTRMTNLPCQWLQCQANGCCDVCRVLRLRA